MRGGPAEKPWDSHSALEAAGARISELTPRDVTDVVWAPRRVPGSEQLDVSVGKSWRENRNQAGGFFLSIFFEVGEKGRRKCLEVPPIIVTDPQLHE